MTSKYFGHWNTGYFPATDIDEDLISTFKYVIELTENNNIFFRNRFGLRELASDLDISTIVSCVAERTWKEVNIDEVFDEVSAEA